MVSAAPKINEYDKITIKFTTTAEIRIKRPLHPWYDYVCLF